METSRTMRVTSIREISVMQGSPIEVEMVLQEDNASGMMESQRLVVAIADQRPVGTKYTVDITYTEQTA